MKREQFTQAHVHFTLAFLLFSIIYSTQVYAGDVHVSAVLRNGMFYQNQPELARIQISNTENYPVFDLEVNVEFYNDATNDLVYSYSETVFSVTPMGQVDVLTWPPYIPDFVGNLRLFVDMFSPDDINPANNTFEETIMVLPGYDLAFSQIDFTQPFNQVNSNLGEVNITGQYDDPHWLYISGFNHTTQEWASLAFNIPFIGSPDPVTFNYNFDLGDLGNIPGADFFSIDYFAYLSTEPTYFPIPELNFTRANVTNKNYDVTSRPGITNFNIPIPTTKYASVFPTQGIQPVPSYAGRAEYLNARPDDDLYGYLDPRDYGSSWATAGGSVAEELWTEEGIRTWHLPPLEGVSDQFLDYAYESIQNDPSFENIVSQKLAFGGRSRFPIAMQYQAGIQNPTNIQNPISYLDDVAEYIPARTDRPIDRAYIKAMLLASKKVEAVMTWYNGGSKVGSSFIRPVAQVNVFDQWGFFYRQDTDESALGSNEIYFSWAPITDGFVDIGGLRHDNRVAIIEGTIASGYDPTKIYDVINPRITQISYEEPFQEYQTTEGQIDFQVAPWDTDLYLNAWVKNPANKMAHWGIRNELLPASEEPYPAGAVLDLSLTGIAPGEILNNLEIEFVSTPAPILNIDSFVRAVLNTYLVEQDTAYIYNGTLDPDLSFPFAPFPQELPDFQAILEQLKCVRINMPNIDLDNATHPGQDGDGKYAGDKNACAPASCANSMQWLESQHEQLQSNLTLREKLEKLSGMMNRAKEAPTAMPNTVGGKLHYVHDLDQQVHVKFQSIYHANGKDIKSPVETDLNIARNKNDDPNGWPSWDFLVQEIKKGEDVELGYDIFDAGGRRTGGHIVMVGGVSEVGGIKRFNIVDDRDQNRENANKLRNNVSYEWKEFNGVPFMMIPGSTKWRRIKYILSESYDRNVVHNMKDLTMKLFENANPQARQNSRSGRLDLTSAPSTDLQMVNIAVSTTDTSQKTWIVRNLVIPPSDSTRDFSIWFDPGLVSNIGVDSGDSIVFHVGRETTVSTSTNFDVNYVPIYPIGSDDYLVGNGAPVAGVTQINAMGRTQPDFSGMAIPDYNFQGDQYEHVDLDSAQQRGGGYAGDWSADGASALASALQYIESTDPNIPVNSALTDKLLSISAAANRVANSGTSRRETIEGVLSWIDDAKTPMKVSFQGIDLGTDSISSPNTLFGHSARNDNNAEERPTWTWLADRVENEKPVIAELGYYLNGQRVGGRWTTIVGTVDYGRAKAIYFVDDSRQDEPGGLKTQYAFFKVHNNGLVVLEPVTHTALNVRVESLVSITYDASVTFNSAVENTIQEFEFSLSPNPALNEVWIEAKLRDPSDCYLFLYDALGRQVWNTRYKNNELELRQKIDLTALAPGNYTVQLVQGKRIGIKNLLIQ